MFTRTYHGVTWAQGSSNAENAICLVCLFLDTGCRGKTKQNKTKTKTSTEAINMASAFVYDDIK